MTEVEMRRMPREISRFQWWYQDILYCKIVFEAFLNNSVLWWNLLILITIRLASMGYFRERCVKCSMDLLGNVFYYRTTTWMGPESFSGIWHMSWHSDFSVFGCTYVFNLFDLARFFFCLVPAWLNQLEIITRLSQDY